MRLTGSPGKPLPTELWGWWGGSWWSQALSRRHAATVPTARTSVTEPLEGGSRGRVEPLVSSQPSLCSTGLTPPEAAPVLPSLFRKAWLPSRSLPWAKTQRGPPLTWPRPAYGPPHPTHRQPLQHQRFAHGPFIHSTSICCALGSGETRETRHSPYLHRGVEERHRTRIIMQGVPCRG